MGKTPSSLVEYIDLLPGLKEATSWELLRQWSLSEVWRVGKQEIADNLIYDIEWQVKIGGICWIIHELRQLLDYGIKAIPVAREWVPDMISDFHMFIGWFIGYNNLNVLDLYMEIIYRSIHNKPKPVLKYGTL